MAGSVIDRTEVENKLERLHPLIVQPSACEWRFAICEGGFGSGIRSPRGTSASSQKLRQFLYTTILGGPSSFLAPRPDFFAGPVSISQQRQLREYQLVKLMLEDRAQLYFEFLRIPKRNATTCRLSDREMMQAILEREFSQEEPSPMAVTQLRTLSFYRSPATDRRCPSVTGRRRCRSRSSGC